ncbi:MAG: aldehyde dehydrogenase EutE [Lachnospiraceae bacterium]|nr:aldehyde dehydrogenase EutE [Lachnospiraceae bacterium]
MDISQYDPNFITKIIREAVAELAEEHEVATQDNYGIFDSMNEAVEASFFAQKKLLMTPMAKRQLYVDTIRATVLEKKNLEVISRMAVDETEIGRYDHKVIKNALAANKTYGTEDLVTEALTGDDGLTLIEYCPFGVIGAITPTTNPTETVICNSICMIAGGNTVVFSPHPRAKNTTITLITMLNKALAEVGAPPNLITTVKEPSIENTNAMMEHPKVRMLVATGGPAIVKKVMSTGKKAIGAGAGNPPVVVDETADIEKAAKDIVNGASFDNNVPCIAEKEVFAVASVYDYLKKCMKDNGAYELTDPDLIAKLDAMVSDEKGKPRVEFVGKSAKYILGKMGIEVGDDICLIIMDAEESDHLVQEEMMMPILPLVCVPDVDEAIACALRAEHGNRHTAIMHSKNVEKLTKMGKLCETTIFVKNAPSYAGIGVGGEGCTTFTIAGPTGEGLTTPRSFCRKRKCVMSEAFNIR